MTKHLESLECDGKHQFAFYYPELNDFKNETQLTIDDKALVRRIINVLRIAIGDTLILFDDSFHAEAKVVESKKNKVIVELGSLKNNEVLKPNIVVGLPLLKKDAMSVALYNCVELGATQVQLLLTEKSQHSWKSHDRERLERVVIAAAEQSKNFAMTEILEPVPLTEWCSSDDTIFWMDVDGAPLTEIISSKNISNFDSVKLLVGPEGDFTSGEKKLLSESNTKVFKLTPTVLRSIQALSVALGYVRSL